jgi:hypothetical protein
MESLPPDPDLGRPLPPDEDPEDPDPTFASPKRPITKASDATKPT